MYQNKGRIEQDDRDGNSVGIGRLNSHEESGRIAGGTRNVAATGVLRGSEKASAYKQRRIVVEWAKDNGCWYDVKDAVSGSKLLYDKSSESEVYLSNEGDYVIKITDVGVFGNSPLNFLDNRIALHNYIFPETFYELLGFCMNKENRFCAITKQPFIKGIEPDETNIYDYMTRDRKFSYIKAGHYKSYDYAIFDLYPKNFVKSASGRLFCIDPMIELNTQNRNYNNI